MVKNQLGSTILLLMVGIVVIVVAGAGALVYKSSTNKQDNTDTADNSRVNSSNIESRLAEPALKRKSDDTEIKNYVSHLAAGIAEYAANNKGNAPESLDIVRQNTPDEKYTDWKNAQALTEGKPAPSTFYYGKGYRCNQSTQLMEPSRPRDYAVATLLLSGTVYCVDL